jgi:hypothetical protein
MKAVASGIEIQCTKAVKGADYIRLYDGENLIASFDGISDFGGYTIDGGEWETPMPTHEEKLREDVDYLLVAEMTREGLL